MLQHQGTKDHQIVLIATVPECPRKTMQPESGGLGDLGGASPCPSRTVVIEKLGESGKEK